MALKNARKWLSLGLVALSLSAVPAGCAAPPSTSSLPAAGASASALIGPSGGEIAIADLRIVIPAGAVASDTEITVHVDDASLPFTHYSPLVRLEPAGLALTRPIEVRIPYAGDATLATAFVAGGTAAAFAPRPTEIAGDVAVVRMTALSSAFVGTACEGASCACEPSGMLDVLVVVDDSTSMTTSQAQLRAQLPRLFGALATGDLDGDGVQDVAAFDDVRVGITTTDLGIGGAVPVPSCGERGDDGVLRAAPGASADPSCGSTGYGTPYASFDASSPDLSGFVSQLSCTSAVGASGCGLEQPLGAGLLALSPSAPTSYTALGWSPPSLPDGRIPQGDHANAGFLRDGSILAVVLLTDEDDCTAADPALFSPADPTYGGVGLNARCVAFPGALVSVTSIVSGLGGLRPRPEDVIVGAIAGMPSGASDPATVLADPSMTPALDTTQPDRVMPVCTRADGSSAAPAQRIVQTLDGLAREGSHVVLQSICDDSFASFTDALAHALAARAGGNC